MVKIVKILQTKIVNDPNHLIQRAMHELCYFYDHKYNYCLFWPFGYTLSENNLLCKEYVGAYLTMESSSND